MQNILTERRIQILKAIVEEYINTAQAVGSETLEKKFQIPASPATIRNEMVVLTEMGYLVKPHKSAGRTPTPMALKYYVKNLMKIDQLSVAEEVAYKEKMWEARLEERRLFLEAVRALSERTGTLSLISTDSGELYYSGASHILDFPEFYDIDLTKTVLSYLDRYSFWQDVSRKPVVQEQYYLLMGDEFGNAVFDACGFVYSKFETHHHSGIVGIVGPYRLEYNKLIPSVVYVASLLSELGK
jgi:heat-inducible transcriptional repressor